MKIVSIQKKDNGDVSMLFDLEDTGLIGKRANIKIFFDALFTGISSVETMTESKQLFETNVDITGAEFNVLVPKDKLEGFAYEGVYLKTHYRAVLKVREKAEFILDNSVFANLTNKIPEITVESPSANNNKKKAFRMSLDFKKTFSAMPLWGKFLFIFSGSLFVLSVLYFLAAYASFSNEGIFYRGREMGYFAIVMSGCFLAYAYTYVYEYLTVKVIKDHPFVKSDSQLEVKDFISVASVVDLKDVTLSVVACSYEKGKVKFRVKTKNDYMVMQSESSDPVKRVLLYEKSIEMVQKNVPFESYFTGKIDFKKMYDELLPVMDVMPKFGIEFDVIIYFKVSEMPNIQITLPVDRFEKPTLKNCSNNYEKTNR